MTDAALKKGLGWGALGVIVTILSSLLLVSWTMGGSETMRLENDRRQQQQIEDHENRIRNLEQVAADVRWIRSALEREGRRP